ncbi:hypothetical protein Bca4012_023838 [Brassica carinata]
MGIMKSCFVFTMGTAYGVYVAQNYNVPDIKKLTNTVLVIFEHIEENYRKPKKDDDEVMNCLTADVEGSVSLFSV